MPDRFSRRHFLGSLLVAVLGGCAERAGKTPTNTTTQTTDEPNMTPTDSDSKTGTSTPTEPEDRKELIEQLPETSPLVRSLEDVVAADDRRSVAEDAGYEFREEDHSVRVSIRLEADGELPDGYRVDVEDAFDGYIEAYVHVDDLVPLAMEPAVRKIQRPAESKPHGGQTGSP
ncbi:hypothetical protein Huta_2152 [Halorhabdus utahensis DSM 12940]|uniref:Uncharacterized protein n=1 Tax=Halorhabdus utahensis (strain DSM 12940 / JCM 11049 / AX-2) TaxID=519442 RepID=C7NU74_HALUD|nr:hypothetical protein [Halorhabdus utahensis]ACV12319.1 hypothetical protein Huta_2152 [Halorhabdus utahensis DSM 12940]